MESSDIKRVTVLYFASARELIGDIASETYELRPALQNMQDLLRVIKERHSSKVNFLAVLQRSLVAVNDEYVFELANVGLKGGEEVAVIPPISGG